MQFVRKGKAEVGSWRSARPQVARHHVATLVFTSGTTSSPKAAALTHGNILYQVETFHYFLQVRGAIPLPLM